MKRQKILDGAIIMMVLAIVTIITFKFVLPAKPDLIIDFKKMDLLDLNKNTIVLSDLLNKEETSYCMIFDLNDCFSCINKGIADLKALQEAGHNAIAIAVHQQVDELNGWSKHHDFSPFFMIRRPDFYQHIEVQTTPVIIKIEKNEIKNFRYILP